MKYLVGVDVWEGSLEMNEDAFIDGGVAYMFIRLNHTLGGHHKDTMFDAQWEQSVKMSRIPYFVYNPWVSGMANFDWLMRNLPSGVTTEMVDIEIKRDGYSPDLYAAEVQTFSDRLAAEGHKEIIYTGEWIKSILSHWPANVDYHLARYPGPMYPTSTTTTTWAKIHEIAESLIWYPSTPNAFPGPCRLWQCSGDRFIVTGTSRPIDINLFQGTHDEFNSYYKLPAVQLPHFVSEPQPDVVAQLVDRINLLEVALRAKDAELLTRINQQQVAIDATGNYDGRLDALEDKIVSIKNIL